MEERHRTNTVDLFRYDQGMTLYQYYLKLANDINSMMSQNKQRIFHNTYVPQPNGGDIFIPMRDRDNQLIDVTIQANRHQNMRPVTRDAGAEGHGHWGVSRHFLPAGDRRNRRSTSPAGQSSSG